jgi:hypothetical protein
MQSIDKDVMKKLIISLRAREEPQPIKDILARYGFPLDHLDITFSDVHKIFVEDLQILKLNEVK